MTEPLIREGKLVGSPMQGVDYDLTKLSREQADQLSSIIRKSETGSMLTDVDAKALLKIRKSARRTGPSNPPARNSDAQTYERLAQSIRQMKELFSDR